MSEEHNQEVRREPILENPRGHTFAGSGPAQTSPFELMNTPQSHISALRVEIDALKHHAQEVDKRHTHLFTENEKRVGEVDKRYAQLLEECEKRAIEVDRRYTTVITEIEKRYDMRIDDLEKNFTMQMTNARDAREKLEMHAEQWRAQANEWRGAMDDRERRYAMKDNMEAVVGALHKELDTLRAEVVQVRLDLGMQAGKGTGMDKMWGYIIAAISAAGAVGVTVAFVAKGAVH